jgi:phage terminase large subunit-like protein
MPSMIFTRRNPLSSRSAWDNMLMGLRVGENPQAIVTTTPRNIAELRVLLKRPGVVVTGGSSYEKSRASHPASRRAAIVKNKEKTIKNPGPES